MNAPAPRPVVTYPLRWDDGCEEFFVKGDLTDVKDLKAFKVVGDVGALGAVLAVVDGGSSLHDFAAGAKDEMVGDAVSLGFDAAGIAVAVAGASNPVGWAVLGAGAAMADPVVLTFAEIEFLLYAQPVQAAAVRAALRLVEPADEQVVSAGLASLIARGLCDVTDDDVHAGDRIQAITAALTRASARADIAVFSHGAPLSVHIAGGSGFRVSITPGPYGQFTFAPMDLSESLDMPLRRLLGRYAAGGGRIDVAIHVAIAGATTDVVLSRDDARQWLMSDSLHNPDRGVVATREDIDARLIELFAPVSVVVG